MAKPLLSVFSRRLGALLQQQRRRRQLTQAVLAERADLSLKYLGEVERGEANTTVRALERIAGVLGWDPWGLFGAAPQPISQPIHQLLVTDLRATQQRIGTTLAWLEALDPTRHESNPAEESPARSQGSGPHRREGSRPETRVDTPGDRGRSDVTAAGLTRGRRTEVRHYS